MTTNKKIISIRLAADLLADVSTCHSSEIAASVVNHYVDFRSMSSFDQESTISSES